MSEFGSVTIGIPTYNRPDGLAKALQCACAQTYPRISIVVSDNASDPYEENEKVVARFSAAGKPVTYIRHQKNIGAGRNFCSLAEGANTDFFCFFADDDRYEDTYVEDCVRGFAQASERCLAVGMEAQYFYQEEVFDFFPEGMRFYCEQQGDYLHEMRYILHNSYGDMFYSLYKTKFLKQKCVLDSFFSKIGNEIPFYLALARFGTRKVLPKPGIYKSAPAATVNFARWQAEGGWLGFSKTYFNLKNRRSTISYMEQLREEILQVCARLKAEHFLLEQECGALMREYDKMRRSVLFECFTGWKRRKGQASQSVQHV